MTQTISPPTAIHVAASDVHGLGVFASVDIDAGVVIERCPVLRVPAAERDSLDATLVFEYYFDWKGDAGVALGYGSLYNHSGEPNAEYIKDYAEGIVEIRSLRPIVAGEEIVFSYTGSQPLS